MAPTVRRKGLPKIIGHEALHSTSITRKSTGTRLLLTIIRTLLILPRGFFLATCNIPSFYQILKLKKCFVSELNFHKELKILRLFKVMNYKNYFKLSFVA
jgi:hypothetical protein